MTALHSQALDGLEEILAVKPQLWMNLRESVNSDKAADRAWDATEMGINEMRHRMTLKRLEKEISAAASALRVLEAEGRNQF